MSNATTHTDFRKPLVKWFAFVIGIIYLISPFQDHLSDVLHTITHGLTLPDYVIEHSQSSFKDEMETHHYGEHITEDRMHEHQLIDFVQSIFESSQDQDLPSEQTIPKISIDKHLTTYDYPVKHLYRFEKPEICFAPDPGIRTGHPTLWLEPPIDPPAS